MRPRQTIVAMNLVQARDLVPSADILERLFFLFPLLTKKRSKKEPTRRPLFLVRVESLVCTVGMIGPSHFAGAGRDALPREPP